MLKGVKGEEDRKKAERSMADVIITKWAINMSSNQSSYEPSTCDCEKYVTKLQSKAKVNQGIYTDHLTLLCFVISKLSYSARLHPSTVFSFW